MTTASGTSADNSPGDKQGLEKKTGALGFQEVLSVSRTSGTHGWLPRLI